MDTLWMTAGLAGGLGLAGGFLLAMRRKSSPSRTVRMEPTAASTCATAAVVPLVSSGLQEMLDAMDVATGIHDLASHAWIINRSARRLLGLGAGAGNDDIFRAMAAFLPVTTRRPPWDAEDVWTEAIIRPGPPETHHRMSVWPLRDPEHRVVRRIVMIQDLSSEARLQRTLQDELGLQREQLELSRREIERQRLEQERLVANISHEVRTPLNHILAYASCLKEEMFGPLTTDQTEALEKIARGAERINHLVNDVLDFARLEGGRVQLARLPLPVSLWVDQSMQFFDAQAIRRNIRFEKVMGQSVPEIEGDLEKLTQVLGNLLSNAFKFTPDGGRIRIQAERSGDRVQVRVSDEGPGIPREHQSRLFERFYQVDASTTRPHGGTGLGLAIAWHLVHLHGGQIAVESEPGKGATFTVTLPAIPAPETPAGPVSIEQAGQVTVQEATGFFVSNP